MTKLSKFVVNFGDLARIAVPRWRRNWNRVGWQAQFFPAFQPTAADGFPSIGARGCYLEVGSAVLEAWASLAKPRPNHGRRS